MGPAVVPYVELLPGACVVIVHGYLGDVYGGKLDISQAVAEVVYGILHLRGRLGIGPS
jgi:hypothetical protein